MRTRYFSLRRHFPVWLVFLFVCGALPSISVALPADSAYEMVSPAYKGGYGVWGLGAVAPSGESIAFKSQGTFEQAPRVEVVGWYLARRQGSSAGASWSTSSLEPPAGLLPSGFTIDVSPSFEATLFEGCYAPNILAGTGDCRERVFVRHATDAPDTEVNWTLVGSPWELLSKEPLSVEYRGASADFCHIVSSLKSQGVMASEAEGTQAQFYDMSTGCGGAPDLHVLGLDNQSPVPKVIDPFCHERLGGFRAGAEGGQANAISANGKEIFFTAFVEPGAGSTGCLDDESESAENPAQVFVRLDGSRTIEVSRPIEPELPFEGCEKSGVPGEVPCEGAKSRPPALFWGASEDGGKVFFTSSAELVAGDTDGSENLYMASIGCPTGNEECGVSERVVTSLVRVSQAGSVGASDVQGIVKIAPDGSHVYFVAHGVLGEGLTGAEDRAPVEGADNLYVFDSATGTTRFVADLCSGPAASGVAQILRCPADLVANGAGVSRNDTELWAQGNETKEAQVNVCGVGGAGTCTAEDETGRFLAFTTYARVLGSDTDDARDAYRYDAQTGAVERVSDGEAGAAADGNCEDKPEESNCDASIASPEGVGDSRALYAQQEMVDRAISANGSKVVFTTAAPLSEDASNGVANVYEWRAPSGGASVGEVSILSSGNAPLGDRQPVLDPSGGNVFFVTMAGLSSRDTDGMADVYDARVGGEEYAPIIEQPERCEGDSCLGSLSPPASLLIPGSVAQAPGGNFTPTAPAVATAKNAARSKKRSTKKKRRRKHGKGTRVARKAHRGSIVSASTGRSGR